LISRAQIFFKKVYPDTNFAEFFCFKKSKPKAVLLSRFPVFTFFFKVGVWGERKFLFWSSENSERRKAEHFIVLSLYIFSRPCLKTHPCMDGKKELPVDKSLLVKNSLQLGVLKITQIKFRS